MTIGKKLYLNFGAVLAMVVVLFLVNLVAVQREHSAKAAASQALQMAQTTDKIRFQMMQNRLYSEQLPAQRRHPRGRPAERWHAHAAGKAAERPEPGHLGAAAKPHWRKCRPANRTGLANLPAPLMDKRKEVDSGNATVAELQIFYLQKDASSWVKSCHRISGRGGPGKHQSAGARRKSDETAATATIVIALFSTLLALALGIAIAYTTAKSITEPLNDLMRSLGRSAMPAIWITKSTSIAAMKSANWRELSPTWSLTSRRWHRFPRPSPGGNLEVEVQPRSKNDTLGNAFVRMIEGLRNLVRNVRDAASQVASASNQVAGASDESAKISLQTSSAIDEVTSTMHEMSVNVQNMVKSTQGAGLERQRNFRLHRSDGGLHSARGRYRQSAARHFQPFARGSPQRHRHHGEGDRWIESHQHHDPIFRRDHRRARPASGRHRQDHRGHRRPGGTNQPAGAERRHRSGARRRTWLGLRRGRRRSPQAGGKVGPVHQGNFRTDPEHPERSPQGGREHGPQHRHRQRRAGSRDRN